MNLTKNIVLTLTVFTTAAMGFAQTTPSSGLLGQRYVQVDGLLEDAHGSSDNLYGAGVGVNLPYNSFLDFGAHYEYDWLKVPGIKITGHTLKASATVYTTFRGVKPFVSANVGQQWLRAKFTGGVTTPEGGLWGFTVGAEVPVAEVTFTPTISYDDGFDAHTTAVYSYGVSANTWFTPKIGVFAGASYYDIVGAGGQGWDFTAGARFRF